MLFYPTALGMHSWECFSMPRQLFLWGRGKVSKLKLVDIHFEINVYLLLKTCQILIHFFPSPIYLYPDHMQVLDHIFVPERKQCGKFVIQSQK